MPEDKKDETDVLEKIELEEQAAKEHDGESAGHDPYNSIPDVEKMDEV